MGTFVLNTILPIAYLEVTQKAGRRFFAQPRPGPVVMLNLLKFKERSDEGGRSGQEEYGSYARSVTKMVEERGGRLVWSGRPEQVLIGDESQEWDMVALVEYPSRKAFVEIAMSPEVAKIGVHRSAGLEGQWLLATTTTRED
jgi:uncharacterized protein (DUF1330 family)